MDLYKSITPILILLCCSACQDHNRPSYMDDHHKLKSQQATVHNHLQKLFLQSAQTMFRNRPIDASVFGVNLKEAGGKYQHELGVYSPRSEAKLRHTMRQLNQQLAQLKPQDQISRENQQVIMDINQYFAGYDGFDIGYIDMWHGLSPFVVNQISGPLVLEPDTMTTNHHINNLNEAEDYLSRLGKFDRLVVSLTRKITADKNQGWVPPRPIVKRAIENLQAFIKPEPVNHSLYQHFAEQVNQLTTISSKQKSKLKQRAKKLVTNHVYPAYQAIITTQQSLLKVARVEAGIWAQPQGEVFYAHAVKRLADTDLSAAEIHQIGLEEVDRITAEMDQILKAHGHTQGSVGHRMNKLAADARFIYEDSAAGRQQLLLDLNGYIAQIEPVMQRQFLSKPPYQVEVRAFPSEREASAPGGMYTSPSIDGSQPGIYWINLHDIKANPKFGLKTLTFHETNPGHHWQIALNLAQDQFPLLRRIAPYNAYIEGWALYAEKIAYELGMYEDDPYGNLGRLKAELFRSVRLVVDTGLHHHRWSREQAIEYMVNKTGTDHKTVTTEIERYMVWPAQALGYKIGMMNFIKLRQQAQVTLGERFDIQAFHDQVLVSGAMRMSLLEQKVDQWVTQIKSTP